MPVSPPRHEVDREGRSTHHRLKRGPTAPLDEEPPSPSGAVGDGKGEAAVPLVIPGAGQSIVRAQGFGSLAVTGADALPAAGFNRLPVEEAENPNGRQE